MSRGGAQPNSLSSRMAAYIAEKVFVTTVELAERFKLDHKAAANLMRQRSRSVCDVQKRGDFWQVGERAIEPPQPQQKVVREFKEYRPPVSGGPIRAGARDFEDIPSRIGDARVPYMR